MSSDRSGYWILIAVIASLIAAIWAWLFYTDLAPLFMFLAGASFTILAQETLERRRRKRDFDIKMTEHIYGPLYKELSSMLEIIRDFGTTGEPTSLEEIIEDFRFDLVTEELGRRIRELRDRMVPYYNLFLQARRETETHIGRSLNKHGIEGRVRFVIWAGGSEIFRTDMIKPILSDKTPLNFLTKMARPYKNVSMIVYAGRPEKSEGKFSSEHKIHQVSKEILEKMREDPSVQEQRREREYLIGECKSLLKLIRKEIVL